MGSCDLTFNKFVIRNQKSDSNHSDIDWLSLAWVYGPPASPQTSKGLTFPLLNLQGSFDLHTGDVLQPFPASFNAPDDSTAVMAMFAITNLAGFDANDQLKQAEQVTSNLAQAAADAYLTAAKTVLEAIASDVTGITWINVLTENLVDPHWSAVLDAVNSAIDAAFQKVIGPVLGAIVGEVQNLSGNPNCSGEVLHGAFLFAPNTNNDGRIVKTFAGPQNNSSCGEPPHTDVDFTVHREVAFIGSFAPSTPPDPNDAAGSEFRSRAEVATKESYVGAFPNFYYGTSGTANQNHVGGTIFIKPTCGQWMDVLWTDLGSPVLTDFAARMRATDDYATKHGFLGGFPNFFQAQHISETVVPGPIPTAAAATAIKTVEPAKLIQPHPAPMVTVCGTVLIKQGCGTRGSIPVSELPAGADIGTLFRFVQDYATKNGYVGGFPTYNLIGGHQSLKPTPQLASMIVILLSATTAVWQDVILYTNPA
jgi:hypothetical protein